MARPISPETAMAEAARGPWDGCWEWPGATNRKGYGIRFAPHTPLVHRQVWEAIFGAIPPGLCVLHRCDNPPCFRPDHLFLGTKGDNNRDMTAKGRHWALSRETCSAGHPWRDETTRVRSLANGRTRRDCLICERWRNRSREKWSRRDVAMLGGDPSL